jgi:hypothetical protein
MIDQKDRNIIEVSDKGKEFSKSIHSWLAQYDEEDDFLSQKTSNTFIEFTEEE